VRRIAPSASRPSAARSSWDALVVAALEGAEATNGFVEPATAEPRRIAPAPGSAPDVQVKEAMDAAEDVTEDADIVQPGDGREGGF